MAKKLKPVHPGEILREQFMKPLGLSMNKLAMDLRIPVTRVAEIYHERRGITANTGLRLARYFNTSAAFWVNLQSHYELEVAEDREAAKIARDVQPLELPRLAERPGKLGMGSQYVSWWPEASPGFGDRIDGAVRLAGVS